MFGVIAAAGAALGMLTDRKHPVMAGVIGAAAGVAAGAAAAGICEYAARESVPLYSSSSPLYEEEFTV